LAYLSIGRVGCLALHGRVPGVGTAGVNGNSTRAAYCVGAFWEDEYLAKKEIRHFFVVIPKHGFAYMTALHFFRSSCVVQAKCSLQAVFHIMNVVK
jgi:hypothetical protein